MKKILLFSILFCAFQLNAQMISFTGESLSGVEVKNLATGQTVSLAPGDYLSLGEITGIADFATHPSTLMVFPNPSSSFATILLKSPSDGEVSVSLHDITGKRITHFRGWLDNSTHSFELRYILNAQGNGYNYSQRIISQGKAANETAQLTLKGKTSNPSVRKASSGTENAQATIPMAYTPGQVLIYTATAGNNKTVMGDVPEADKTVEFIFETCKDADDYYYTIVKLGDQIWMAENLRTSKFANGESIPTTDPVDLDYKSQKDPVYQWVAGGDENNLDIYGRQYTFYAATDARKVCPEGWHVPSKDEWTTLTNFVGENPGEKLKETGTSLWQDPNVATNTTAFSVRPAGYRHAANGFSLGASVNILSTTITEGSTVNVVTKKFENSATTANNYNFNKKYGATIRCLKD